MGKKKNSGRATLSYPEHILKPVDFLTFVELDEFVDDWSELDLDEEIELWDLQVLIMAHPKGSQVVRGTGGLRKLRFSPSQKDSGKSKGIRVCYVYLEEYALVLLVAAYDHQEKDNLSASEKKCIKEYIQQSKQYLSTRSYK